MTHLPSARPTPEPGTGAGATRPGQDPAALLPEALSDGPAAVVLVDLDQRAVTSVNAAAAELVGGCLRRPADVQAWSDAAGLAGIGITRTSARRVSRP